MEFSFPLLKAFERELNAQFAAFAADYHNDAHNYKVASVQLLPAHTKSPRWVAILELKLDIVYDFDDDPFEDEYSFRYGIATDGSLGRYNPDAPPSQEQVFHAYRTWGRAITEWVNSILAFFRAARAALQPVHEELIARHWHPDRVADMLERGGWEAIEAS
jgi:hypothetical protein